MPRYVNDEYIQAWWADVADPAFVAQSELVAGVELACHMTKDGLKTGFTESSVDDGALCEAFDAELPGSYKTAVELTLKRRNTVDGDTDVAWNLFSTRGETGTLVVRRGILADVAPTAGQAVEVYPGTTGIRRMADVASNEQAKFMITIFGSSAPELDGIVVAS
jgi:hypothetical protein